MSNNETTTTSAYWVAETGAVHTLTSGTGLATVRVGRVIDRNGTEGWSVQVETSQVRDEHLIYGFVSLDEIKIRAEGFLAKFIADLAWTPAV